MITPSVLSSRNLDHDLFGTLTICPLRDRRSTQVWALASRLIAEAIRAHSIDDRIGIRDFLDSRIDRQFADDVVSNMTGCDIDFETAMKSAIRRWQGWRIDRRTARGTGIPEGMPYLTGSVQHFAIAAAMSEAD